VRLGPRSCRCSSSGSASMTSRRSPPRQGERTRRSAAEATRRWRIHPTVSAHTGEGLGRRLGLALSAAARRPLVSLAAARERERGRGRMRLGFAQGRRARFCSAENLAQPSDLDGRLTLTGASFSLGGMKLSRPRPRLRPGARDAPSASGPLG
jgi:hypothetical protein